jgi:conjugal transfer pilus assembly protein TraA
MELHMQSFTLSRRSGAIDQRPSKFGRAMTFAVPLAVATLAASAAYAGADTTFTPALTKFTDFLEGSGGKIITVLSLAGGLIGLASGGSRSARSPFRWASASASARVFRSSPRS